MNVNIISINPITVIPLLRYIVQFFIAEKKSNVSITETHVKNFNNYYNDIDKCSFDNISEYDSYEEFKNQTTKFKFSKYLFILKKLFSVYSQRESQLIYTNDYQVLFFIFIVRFFYKPKKVKVIYHQYELIEFNQLNKINRLFYSYTLKKAHSIDLTIFSEINRLNYFAQESSLIKEKSMVLPNSCYPAKPINKSKHELFNQLPKDSYIVAHMGNVGGNQHYFNNFIETIELLKPNKRIVFVFIGRKSKIIEEIIKTKNLPNLFFINPVPHEELDQIYPFIDLGIILYKGTGLNYEYCAPNKLYELWKNGVPVLAHELKGLTPLFENKTKGILSNFDSPREIAKTIISCTQQKDDKTALKELFNETLSIDIYLKKFSNKLLKL